MKRAGLSPGKSNLPIPKSSKGSPGNAKSVLTKGGNQARSAEDIPRRVQLSVGSSGGSPQRRAVSPGTAMRKGLPVPVSPSTVQNGQSGVRYITEDLIRKLTHEDSLEVITTLNLTLAKEGGKKIKYIENLDRLKKLQVLILSHNMIEKIERCDKLLKLKELNLSFNCITKIEGLENLTNLQLLNLTGNLIEHIPIWMGKRLKSLRAFHIGQNRLESLSELAKLKPLPDLTQLSVAENPLATIQHCRGYLVFHLRTVEILDSQQVTDRERQLAKDRFEQDELEKLEKTLEDKDLKIRRLEEDHNRSQQERHHLSANEEDLRKREKSYADRVKELERELETKNDILKKKTSELNKACEKHYQLEQELAFHKIDSKFDSLGRGPEPIMEGAGDDMLGESPYIGRARYKPNKFAAESEILSQAPSQVQIQSLPGPARADVKLEINQKLDSVIAEKQHRVAKAIDRQQQAEDRLKRLSEDLQLTEDKLLKATAELKNIGDSAVQEKEDQRQQQRQKLARKMRTVNELRDSATQIEEQINKTKTSMHKNKMDVSRLKAQLTSLDSKDPTYRRVYGEMVDKEQQINESNQMYGQLQDQLELMLDTIARETSDIKKLEASLNDDQLEQNESLREELDEIVGGLQHYLASVQAKGSKREAEFDQLLREREELQERCQGLEMELSVMDTEAGKYREMEKMLAEAESTLRQQEDRNRTLQEQVHRSRQQDTDNQDYLESREMELASVKKALKDTEQKLKAEKQMLEKQLQTEKAKAIDGERKAKDADRRAEEIRKLTSQLETVKAQNTTLKEKLDQDTSILQARLNDSIAPQDLRRRLKELSQSVKQGKVPIEVQDDRDILGKSFKDLQSFVHDKLNRSSKEADLSKSRLEKLEDENQSLRENLKHVEAKLAKRDEKVKGEKNKFKEDKKADMEEISRLNAELQRLRNALNRARQGKGQTKIVHDPDSGSEFSRRSSLNSEERLLFDELQKELMDLKRAMRSKEEDASKKLLDAETEAAMLEQTLQEQEKGFEQELSRLKEHMDLQRERQEARMQVIAADLDQAQRVADVLQHMLDERESQLHSELNQADISNQLIVNQEEELAKLYDILETQKSELGRLNNMLDSLSNQGVNIGTAGADDELWKLRQEVNHLKETLAMQSAYVQTMPPPSMSSGVQAGTGSQTPYTMADQGQAAGPVQRPLGLYREAPMSMMPPGIPKASMGTSYAPPGYGAGRVAVHAGVGVGAGVSMGVGVGGGGGGGEPDPYYSGSGGADQREVKTPPGGRPSGGRSSRHSRSPHKRRTDRGVDADGADYPSDRSHKSGRSRRSGRSRGERGRSPERRDREKGHRETQRKTAFEPVVKPQAYRPVMSQGPVNTYSTPAPAYGPDGRPVPMPQPEMAMSGPGMMVGPTAQPGGTGYPPTVVGGASVGPAPQQQAASHTGPFQPVITTRGLPVQSGPGAVSGPPGTTPQGYQVPPGYSIPSHPGAAGYGPTAAPANQTAGPPGVSAQTPGYAATQTPGYSATQTPGGVGATLSSGYGSVQTPSGQPSLGGMGINMGGNPTGPAFVPAGQPLSYNPDRVFVPAYPTSPSKPPARVYYSTRGSGRPASAPPPSPPPPALGALESNIKFLPVMPLAQGTPITGHHAPRTSQDVSLPSPIRYNKLQKMVDLYYCLLPDHVFVPISR